MSTWTFQPPYAMTGSKLGYSETGRPHRGNVLMRHFGNQGVGQTVYRLNGVYYTREYPLDVDLANSTEVYLGGHIYTVDDATAADLIAAGFEPTTPAEPEQPEMGFGLGDFGTSPFGL